MAFEELNDNTEKFYEGSKSFLESSLAYYKLKVFKLAMQSISLILKMLLIGLCLAVFLLFCSLAVSFAINDSLNSNYLGFLIVGGAVLFLYCFDLRFQKEIGRRPYPKNVFKNIF